MTLQNSHLKASENTILSSVPAPLPLEESKQDTTKSDQCSPNYLALYGLRESAFSQVIDDRFYFADTEQVERLKLLHNLIQEHNLFLHIHGVSGVGKSSLINRFINAGEEDWRFSFFPANAMMNSEQLFFNISTGFGLSGLSDNSKSLKDICLKNIALLEKSGVVPILIIDDVQELPLDALKSIFDLVNRWDKNHPKLRIILISNPQFEKILNSDEIKLSRKLISHVMELEPLTEEQIGHYIYFRLSVAGLDGGNPITPGACSVISKKSKGLPEKINNLCHIALRDGMDEMTMKEFFDDHNFNFPLRKYLITGSVLAIFLGVIFSVVEPFNFNDNFVRSLTKISNIKSRYSNTAISTTSILAHLTDEKIQAEQENSNNTNIEHISDIVSNRTKPLRLYDFTKFNLKLTNEIIQNNSNAIFNIIKLQFTKKKHNKVVLRNKTQSSSRKNNNPAILNYQIDKLTTITSKRFPEITSITPINLVPGNAEKMISLYGLRFGDESRITIYSNSIAKEIEKNNITYISNTQLNMKFIPGNFKGKNWVVVTDPLRGKSNSKLLEISNSVARSLDKLNFKIMQDKQWILAQKSDLYILHILGSRHKDEIVNFANDEKINGQFAIFETNRNGTEWYHLILGTYKNRDAAKLAIQNFPKTVNRPWIRQIKDIQNVIKRFNQNTL